MRGGGDVGGHGVARDTTALCGVLATSVKTGCRVLTNHMVGICHMLARDPGLLYCRDGAEDMIG